MHLRATAVYALHNLVAHPLLVIFPPIGEWLHSITIPESDPDERSEVLR